MYFSADFYIILIQQTIPDWGEMQTHFSIWAKGSFIANHVQRASVSSCALRLRFGVSWIEPRLPVLSAPETKKAPTPLGSMLFELD